MPSDLHPLKDLHRAAVAEIDTLIASLIAQEEKLRQEYDACRARRADAEGRRGILDQAGEIYEELIAASGGAGLDGRSEAFEPASSPDPQDAKSKPLRARIGDQRYLMLSTLRSQGPNSPEEIAALTGLQARRVRDQLSSDTMVGTVTLQSGFYRLTKVGHDLLARFESYRKSRNLPLPTLEDAIAESDRDDGEFSVEEDGITENGADADDGEASDAEAPDQAEPAGASSVQEPQLEVGAEAAV